MAPCIRGTDAFDDMALIDGRTDDLDQVAVAAVAGAAVGPSAGAGPSLPCLQGILFVLYNDLAWQLLPL